MVDERIAARRAEVRQDRRRRRLRRTILVATLLVLVAVGVVVERSSLVALAEVRVAGTERLDPRSVRRAADLELGTSTLRLPLGAARERVEALPLVERADVRRVDPLTVLVEVEERQPAAVVRHGDDTVLVDREGVVLATGSEPGLPLIRMPEGRLPRPGQGIDRAPAAANAHAALGQLPGPVRSLVSSYVARAEDELVLRLASGTRVRFGRADQVAEKARALGAVLEDVGERSVAVIDVRAPSRPVVDPGTG
jgi:cell division protein FtsQ